MKYLQRLNLAAQALIFTTVRPGRLLLLALVVGGLALVGSHADTNATHGPPGTKLWGYEAAFHDSRILEYNIGAHGVPVSSCVPTPSVNGRGIAFDPADGNLWYTYVNSPSEEPASEEPVPESFAGDGLIHKTTPPPGCNPLPSIPFADGPGPAGSAIQNDVGALDVDPDDNNLWAAGYTAQSGLSFLYKIDRTNGALLTSCSVPVGAGGANDTLAVAKIAGLAGSGKYLLTDAADPGAVNKVLHVIDVAACVGGPVTPIMDVTLPVGVTGIDYEAIDDSGGPDLIATDLYNIYDLGSYPFSSSTAAMTSSIPLPGGLEDITMVCTCFEIINLDTGYDQFHKPFPRPMDPGEQDNEWRVIVDPNDQPLFPNDPPPVGFATGRQADVVTNVWGTINTTNYPNSRWISTNPQARPNQIAPTDFTYAFYFTLPPDFSAPQLTMKLNSDDTIQSVLLNGNPGCLPNSGKTFITNDPVLNSSSAPNCFKSGPDVNVLEVTVRDTLEVYTGLIVAGTVTYECCDHRLPVIKTPDLKSITFWESTFADPTPETFLKDSPLLKAQLTAADFAPGAIPGPDFESLPDAEMYDFFYSNWDGTLNPNGQFVTIEAVVPGHSPPAPCCLPSGGGLNIAAVQLNYLSGAVRFADSVSSFVAFGDNSMPGIVGYAVDGGVLSTDTTMGNTSAPPPAPQRLRLTVGFPCNCTPPPSDMVAWWPLDETSGTLVRDIRGGHNGTTSPGPIGPSTLATNGPEPADLWPPAVNAGGSKVGNALHFWGQSMNRYVRVPDKPTLQFGTTLSIDAWVLITQYGGTAIQPIVEKMQYGKTPVGYLFYIEDGYLRFKVSPDNPSTTHSADTQMTQNVWHHVAVTVDRSQADSVRLYVDGSAVSSPISFILSDFSNTQDLIIGGSTQGPAINYLDIAIDEVEIFDRVLMQEEVNKIYIAGSDGKCPPPGIPVGGIVGLTVSISGASVPSAPLAAVAASAMTVLAAAFWYGRRRWLR